MSVDDPSEGPSDNFGPLGEGNIFDRLRAAAPSRAAAGDGTDPDIEIRERTGQGHDAVDSSRVNEGVLAASRAAASSDADTPSVRYGVNDPSTVLGAGGSGAGDVATAGGGLTHAGPDHPHEASQFTVMLVVACFLSVILSVAGFTVTFIIGEPHKSYYTPVLGTCMGLALLGLGAGAVIWAKYVMPHEDAVQERHEGASTPQDIAAAQETWRRGVEQSGFLSQPLIRRSLLAASGVLGVLAIVPLRALGALTSNQNAGALAHTSWKKGDRMLAVPSMQPLRAGDLAIGGLATVIPEGTENDDIAQASSVAIVVRLDPNDLHPLPGREGLDYEGHVVFSKICTHLGCPVSLYEQQTHKLLCPCHQSQFLATENARPIFGPADRRLPQLAVTVDDDGYFIARDGDFPEPIGPGYWERT